MALATLTDIAFTPYSLFSALLSVAVSSARSVVFKGDTEKGDMNASELYLRLGLLSFLLTTPFQLFFNAFYPYPTLPDYRSITFADIISLGAHHDGLRFLILGGGFHFVYNLYSFKVLKAVSPLTHGLANVMKRITTIVYSIIYFRTPLSFSNTMGIVISNIGVLLFGYYQKKEPKANPAKTSLPTQNYEPKQVCAIVATFITLAMMWDNEVLVEPK
jgi:hypothetical protein